MSSRRELIPTVPRAQGVYPARFTPAGKLVEYEQLPGTAASRTAGNGRVAHEPRWNRVVTS